jgi:hypothetical protein
MGFVRRAYRKFGKEQMTRYDLRWKGQGVRALAGAITRRAGPGGEVCTPQALAWADDAEGSAVANAGREERFAVSHEGADSVAEADGMHRDDSGSSSVPVPPSGGVPAAEGMNWVLTWPSDVSTTLDLQRLVLIGRTDALHRSRNAQRKRKRKATAESETEDAAPATTAMAAEEEEKSEREE